MDIDKIPGLKESELEAHGPCPICGKPLINGEMSFYRVKIEHCVWNPRAIERRQGLEMMLGSGPLSRVMGPNEDLAKIVTTATAYVHEECATEAFLLARICESKAEEETRETQRQ